MGEVQIHSNHTEGLARARVCYLQGNPNDYEPQPGGAHGEIYGEFDSSGGAEYWVGGSMNHWKTAHYSNWGSYDYIAEEIDPHPLRPFIAGFDNVKDYEYSIAVANNPMPRGEVMLFQPETVRVITVTVTHGGANDNHWNFMAWKPSRGTRQSQHIDPVTKTYSIIYTKAQNQYFEYFFIRTQNRGADRVRFTDPIRGRFCILVDPKVIPPTPTPKPTKTPKPTATIKPTAGISETRTAMVQTATAFAAEGNTPTALPSVTPTTTATPPRLADECMMATLPYMGSDEVMRYSMIVNVPKQTGAL